ncbi:MAG TPA: hypothetical protein VF773_21305 [Verrucomicrobiae bacterium]
MHYTPFLTSALIVALLFSACGKPPTRKPLNESELIGKWTAVEIISNKGNRGPTEGILDAHIEFFADHSSTGVLVWTGSDLPNPSAAGPHPWSATWTFTNAILHQKHGTNDPSSSDVWFEDNLLIIQDRPLKRNSLTLILKRAE